MKVFDNLFSSLYLFFDAIDDGRPGNKESIDVVNSPYDLDFIKKTSSVILSSSLIEHSDVI